MRQYRIGDYAKYLGVTPDFLKHYEEMGLIRPSRSESGYRYYSFQTTMDLIECIRLRNYGLTLREIEEILTEHRAENGQVEELLGERMQRIEEEILLDEALTEEYADFRLWRESLETRDWDWEIRRSRPMCFLPHTSGVDFLEDGRIYEILNDWMSYIPIVKSSVRIGRDGEANWGFVAEERMLQRLHLPENDIVERYPAQKIFYYKFRGPLLRKEEERADNPDHPAFRQLHALGLEGGDCYFRTTLMPADWKRDLGYQYGYYAILLQGDV